jgi:glycosyltransferase involved in cell wall biosynthesis
VAAITQHMRLTYICGFAWEPKGTVRARAFPLAEEMARRGHDVSLIIAPYDNLAHSGEQFTSNGVRVVNLEIKSRGPAALARIPFDLLKKVDQTCPDIVHVFKPKGFSGLAAMWLLRRNQAVVLDCDDWEGWGGWNEIKGYPWIVKEFIDFQEKWVLRRAPAITAASQILADRALSLGKDDERVFYVPNGPTQQQLELSKRLLEEAPELYRHKFELKEVPVILYAGHYDPADDVMFFCRAVARIVATKRLSLIFAGDGPELTAVRSFFASKSHVSTYFLGATPYEQYAELVAAADICAFPYPDTPIYRAKCSARIIDYMLFGKAVVSTSVGQNREYIVDDVSGLLTPPGDEAEFAQALARLIEDAELRRRLGRNARARILQHFLWSERAGDNCESAYRSLVPRKQFQTVSLLAS